MSNDQTPNNQAGYALLDALVGLAISSIVLVMTVTGMRNAAALHQRYEQEAIGRRQVMTAYTTLQRLLEHMPLPEPDARQNAIAGEIESYPLGISPLIAGAERSDLPSTLNRVSDATPQRVSLVLAPRVSPAGEMIPLLKDWPDIRMMRYATPGLLAAGHLTVIVLQANGSEFAHLHLSHPSTVDARRIAQPLRMGPRAGSRNR